MQCVIYAHFDQVGVIYFVSGDAEQGMSLVAHAKRLSAKASLWMPEKFKIVGSIVDVLAHKSS